MQRIVYYTMIFWPDLPIRTLPEAFSFLEFHRYREIHPLAMAPGWRVVRDSHKQVMKKDGEIKNRVHRKHRGLECFADIE